MKFRLEFELDVESRALAEAAADAADSALMDILGSEYVISGPLVPVDEGEAEA